MASYEYTEDANRYLSRLDYSNGDKVQYTYDNKGRLLTQTYEDGDKVTYTYDNNGALATMVDHATGITTTYYYDLSDRMAKYTESGAGYSHSVEYTYDVKNNLQKLEESINGVDHTTEYEYDDDNRIETVTANGTTITYTYDDFGRVTQKVTTNDEGTLRTESYTYVAPQSGKTSAQVATYSIVTGNTTQTYTYTYDGNGNITSIFDGTYTTSYAYDSANQLIQENIESIDYTYSYTYDNAGNMTERGVYNYSPNLSSDDVCDYEPFYYEDSDWGDLLTEYYAPFEYDAIGNLTQDETRQYTWEHGRQLASLIGMSDTWEFSYNTDGLRTQRTNGTTTYSYIYTGTQLTQMTVDGYTLSFFYDAEGKPSFFTYYDGADTTTYYYATNLQGDVTGIFQENGVFVVNYTYDAWGRVRSVTGIMRYTLGSLNPLRYRGYVYDEETGYYYLQSRYYNPEFCRFINADGFVATGQGLLGNNMFAYCNNNPVLLEDSTGTRPILSTSLRNETTAEKDYSFAYMHQQLENERIQNKRIQVVIAQTVYGETGGRYEYDDWEEGMQAVATIINNRKDSQLFPNDYISVCTQAYQFDGYARGRAEYISGNCDTIMWNHAMMLAETMVNGHFVSHPSMTPQYLYFHSERYGNPDRISAIKNKHETLTIAGNMFYINYGG